MFCRISLTLMLIKCIAPSTLYVSTQRDLTQVCRTEKETHFTLHLMVHACLVLCLEPWYHVPWYHVPWYHVPWYHVPWYHAPLPACLHHSTTVKDYQVAISNWTRLRHLVLVLVLDWDIWCWIITNENKHNVPKIHIEVISQWIFIQYKFSYLVFYCKYYDTSLHIMAVIRIANHVY